MVGVPGRSRGCLTCRQRKIKCDEALPTCSQCRRSRRRYTCTGSVTGLFISIATPEHTKQRSVTQKRQDHIESKASKDSFQSSYRTVHNGRASNVLAPEMMLEFPLPPYPPSPTEALVQHFISHFIRTFGDTRNAPPFWLDQLPELYASSMSGPFKDSVRAATTLFYGVLTRDIPIQTEANRHYAKALHGLRSRLESGNLPTAQQATLASTVLTSNSMVICATIMMCHFEMMTSSSPHGWINHIEAAASMIEARGPENCRLGLEHQMFLTVRLFTLFVSMTTNKVHRFTSEPWMTTPFTESSRTLWHELIDILLLLPECLITAQEVLLSEREEPCELENKLQDSVFHLVTSLDCWQSQYPFATNSLETPFINSGEAGGRSHDAVARALVAVFDAASVIAFSLLILVSPSADHSNYNHRAEFHTQAVIHADAYIDSKYVTVPGGGSLLMAFALKIIGLWGPLQEQRDHAVKRLRIWDQQLVSHDARCFAAPVYLDCDAESESSNVYFANVANEVSRRRAENHLIVY
ncbi:hypothetical protein F5884DRAFT_779531 [Xylogone sp. PMI_703]|nr:hypothetical protein F5884DRAFT_779531 [Xylogone sp. PMI_703]